MNLPFNQIAYFTKKNNANKALELMATFAPLVTFRLPTSWICNP